jgi:hypothetical protein
MTTLTVKVEKIMDSDCPAQKRGDMVEMYKRLTKHELAKMIAGDLVRQGAITFTEDGAIMRAEVTVET